MAAVTRAKRKPAARVTGAGRPMAEEDMRLVQRMRTVAMVGTLRLHIKNGPPDAKVAMLAGPVTPATAVK